MGWLSGLHISQICWINQCVTSRWCSDWWISSAHLPLSITLKDNGEHWMSQGFGSITSWRTPFAWDFFLSVFLILCCSHTHTHTQPTKHTSRPDRITYSHTSRQEKKTQKTKSKASDSDEWVSFGNTSPCCPQPPTDQHRAAMMPPVLFGSLLKKVPTGGGEWSPPPKRHMCSVLFLDLCE